MDPPSWSKSQKATTPGADPGGPAAESGRPVGWPRTGADPGFADASSRGNSRTSIDFMRSSPPLTAKESVPRGDSPSGLAGRADVGHKLRGSWPDLGRKTTSTQ